VYIVWLFPRFGTVYSNFYSLIHNLDFRTLIWRYSRFLLSFIMMPGSQSR